MTPPYVKLLESGALEKRAASLRKLMEECTLCPRRCGARRLEGETGDCSTGRLPVVSSSFPHFGEESPLVGRRGSGTIFFTHCNLLCSFCQNYDISHEGSGEETSIERLAGLMLSLQKTGCHNLNFVTPTHVIPMIVEALVRAAGRGLTLPLVYNCGGYESTQTLKLLDGIIDIYMPDFKFWDARVGLRFTGVKDYPERAREALKEMHRQVGDLVIDEDGIAQRGILLRHLVMPDNLAGTREVMKFTASEISTDTYVNVMPQYRPCGEVHGEADAGRRITEAEYREAVEAAVEAGLRRLDERRIALLFL
jgi:putative pyruvate formate lyase activating enzyme